jgi:hypothetical protein
LQVCRLLGADKLHQEFYDFNCFGNSGVVQFGRRLVSGHCDKALVHFQSLKGTTKVVPFPFVLEDEFFRSR